MTVELATHRYRTFEPSMGVPVAITVGMPKWPLGYELKHRIRRLAPWGLMKLDGEAFDRAYRARLEGLDFNALLERFEAISPQEGGRRLVLLCYEPPGAPCHRRLAASYIQTMTGQPVPELSAVGHLPPGQRSDNLATAKPHIVPRGQLRLDLDQTAPAGGAERQQR